MVYQEALHTAAVHLQALDDQIQEQRYLLDGNAHTRETEEGYELVDGYEGLPVPDDLLEDELALDTTVEQWMRTEHYVNALLDGVDAAINVYNDQVRRRTSERAVRDEMEDLVDAAAAVRDAYENVERNMYNVEARLRERDDSLFERRARKDMRYGLQWHVDEAALQLDVLASSVDQYGHVAERYADGALTAGDVKEVVDTERVAGQLADTYQRVAALEQMRNRAPALGRGITVRSAWDSESEERIRTSLFDAANAITHTLRRVQRDVAHADQHVGDIVTPVTTLLRAENRVRDPLHRSDDVTYIEVQEG